MRGPQSTLFRHLAVLTVLAVLVSIATNRLPLVSQVLNLKKVGLHGPLTKQLEIVHNHPSDTSTSSPTRHTLKKRWTTCNWDTALDDVPSEQADPCQKIVQAGKKIFCMMRTKKGDPNIPKTQFENDADLETYGWDYETLTISSEDFGGGEGGHFTDDYSGLLDAFKGVDPHLHANGWIKVTAEHKGNNQWPRTSGVYGTVVNQGQGALISYSSWSPEVVNKQTVGKPTWVPPEKMTPLARRSDVVYLDTKRLFGNDVAAFKNLKHFFEHDVTGEVGLDVLRMIVDRENPDRPEDNWPGTVLEPPLDPKFFAALGSPNSKFLGWLYGQHKDVVGIAFVDQINIFNCPTYDYDKDQDPMDDDDDDDDDDDMDDKIKRGLRRRDTKPSWCMYFKIRQLPARE